MLKNLFIVIQKLLSRVGFLLTRPSMALDRNRIISVLENADYVRIASLELVAQEILEKDIEGDIAELGVYKGLFASKMNQVFPQKRLFLFDTFDGFSEIDVTHERTAGYSTGIQDFSGTDVVSVLNIMKYPKNCVIKKGYFPSTTEGIDSTFAFVNIDADLFQPIYEGLKFFYHRLARGGYIFVHDYNNSEYKGSREAVRTFCREENIGYVPLCDAYGSVVIAK